MLSSLTSCVPLLPYPARFRTRMDPDIFDEIARFHRNKCYFADYDKGFFRKISRVPLLLIQVLQGEACNSAAMKKKTSSIPCPEGKDLKVLNLPSNLHRQSPDVTLTSCVPLLPYPAHFRTQVDPDIFDGIARFHPKQMLLCGP